MTVAAVIPVYNRASLLAEAVSSVLDQAWLEEVVIVDDGSTDETPEVADAIAAKDSRVRVVRIDHCGMPGRVRNVGVGVVRTNLVAFLDSDDLWLPGKVEAQVAYHAANPRIRISHTGERWIRNGRIVSQRSRRHRREGDIFSDALVKCTMGPSTVMVDRGLLESTGGFREDLEIAEDYELWLRICDTETVGYVDREFTVKRAGHGDQLSERYGQIERFRIAALRRLVEDDVLCHADLAREELVRKCRIYARGAARRGRHAEAEEYERVAARHAR